MRGERGGEERGDRRHDDRDGALRVTDGYQ